jgi:hypothetical protein
MQISELAADVRACSPRREVLMSAVAVSVPVHLEHRWELRLEEFEDGLSFRRFECVDCGAVRFE